MKISVETQTGKTVTLDVESSGYSFSVKAMAQQGNAGTSGQRMVKHLEEGSTVVFYNVQNDSTINLSVASDNDTDESGENRVATNQRDRNTVQGENRVATNQGDRNRVQGDRAAIIERQWIEYLNSTIALYNELTNQLREREARRARSAQTEDVLNKNKVWNAIVEISDLDDDVRYKAITLICKFGMEEAFMRMSTEHRRGWINWSTRQQF